MPPAEPILIVEDDPSIGGSIVRGLRRAGFSVELCTGGSAGAAAARSAKYVAIVLDLMLPEVDGVDILRCVPRPARTPVIVVSARSDLAQRLQVFSLGAIDFLPKPFFVDELIARLNVHLGRIGRGSAYTLGRVVIEPDATRVEVDGEPVTLSPAERTVLARLLDAQGTILSREAIAESLGVERAVSHRTVDSYVARLRGRFGDDGRRIETVWGQGYRLRVEDPP